MYHGGGAKGSDRGDLSALTDEDRTSERIGNSMRQLKSNKGDEVHRSDLVKDGVQEKTEQWGVLHRLQCLSAS